MTAQALLDTLHGRGLEVVPDGDGLIVRLASRLTDADRQAIRALKPALLAILNGVGEPGTCEHVVDDPELAAWYRENPHLTCGRCFLAGAPLRSGPQ